MQPVELPPMQAHHIDATTGLDEISSQLPPEVAAHLAMADRAIAGSQTAFAPTPEKRAPMQTRKGANGAGVDPGDPATWGRVSRNQPCPCGSGKKYKHCHGKLD